MWNTFLKILHKRYVFQLQWRQGLCMVAYSVPAVTTMLTIYLSVASIEPTLESSRGSDCSDTLAFLWSFSWCNLALSEACQSNLVLQIILFFFDGIKLTKADKSKKSVKKE